METVIMPTSVEPDGLLKSMAAQAVEHGDTLRQPVRDLTLRALSSREATIEQLSKVLESVTAGVSQGAAVSKVDAAQLFKDALAAMDEAVMKVVEANQVVLNKLAGAGGAFEQSQFKKALDDVQQIEEHPGGRAGGASKRSSIENRVRGRCCSRIPAAGSQTGAQAREVAETFTRNIKAAAGVACDGVQNRACLDPELCGGRKRGADGVCGSLPGEGHEQVVTFHQQGSL
jgi:hypothetical protein